MVHWHKISHVYEKCSLSLTHEWSCCDVRSGHDDELPVQRARHHQLPVWEGPAVATLQRRTRPAQVTNQWIVCHDWLVWCQSKGLKRSKNVNISDTGSKVLAEFWACRQQGVATAALIVFNVNTTTVSRAANNYCFHDQLICSLFSWLINLCVYKMCWANSPKPKDSLVTWQRKAVNPYI